MNRKHIALTASCCALTFGLFACSDDVIEVDEVNSFVTVDSLDDTECTDDNEGSMVFEKNTTKMFVCSDGSWHSMDAEETIQRRCAAEALKDSTGYKITCDGNVIGTVTNGTNGSKGATGDKGATGETGDAGETGAVGTVGETGQKGSDGANGTSIDTNAVVKAVYDSIFNDVIKNTSGTVDEEVSNKVNTAASSASASITENVKKDVLAKNSCELAGTETNEETSMMTITIDCNGVTSDFEVPVLIPNENLEKVYSKSVFVRFPALAGSCNEPNRYFNQMNSSAELVIAEVDENFNTTGKSFSSDAILQKDENGIVTYNSVTKEETQACGYLLRMKGSFSIKNLISDYAKISATVEVSSTNLTFSALVDMGEESGDTIVLDFLSDYKAARVKNLIDNGSSFDAASKQANSELAVAFGLSEDAAAFEYTLSSKISDEELEVMTLLPGALMSANVSGTNNSANLVLYNGYKGIFAENGDFKKPLEEKISMYTWFASYQGVIGYNKEPAKYLIDFLYNTGYYSPDKKFVQKGFADVYKLGACSDKLEKNVVLTSVKDGFYKIFECIPSKENWVPAAGQGVSDVFDVLLNDLTATCDVEAALAGKKETVTYGDQSLVAVCYNGQMGYQWGYVFGPSCEGLEENKYYSYTNGDFTQSYYKCVEGEEEGTLVAEDVSLVEYKNGACNSETEDNLYTDGVSNNYYACSEDDGIYSYFTLNYFKNDDGEYVYNGEGIDQYVVTKLYFACDDKNEGKTVDAYIYPGVNASTQFICKNGNWEREEETERLPQAILDKLFEECNASLEAKGKVFKINEGEVYNSADTRMAYYKCFSVAVENETYEYEWRYATDLDVQLNKACSKSLVDETVTNGFNNKDYVCTEVSDANDPEDKFIWISPSIYCDENHESFLYSETKNYVKPFAYNVDVDLFATCEYRDGIPEDKKEHLVTFEEPVQGTPSDWYNGANYCLKVYGKCSNNLNVDAFSSCIFPYDYDESVITGGAPYVKADYYRCESVEGDDYGVWVKDDIENFCEAQVRRTKSRFAHDGDVCYLANSETTVKFNKPNAEKTWLSSGSIDGSCTAIATAAGDNNPPIPSNKVCDYSGGKNLDNLYVFNATEYIWFHVVKENACNYEQPDADIGATCQIGAFTMVKGVDKTWVEENTLDGHCSYTLTEGGKNELASDATCRYNIDGDNIYRYYVIACKENGSCEWVIKVEQISFN